MPIRFVKYINPAPITDPALREAAVSAAVTRLGKGFKKETKDNMVNSTPTGILYRRGPGAGFSRYHRASARFERPAPDTLNLVNSIRDEKTGSNSVQIYVDDTTAPYGAYLQSERLERPIMTEEDAVRYIADGPGKAELNALEQELIK